MNKQKDIAEIRCRVCLKVLPATEFYPDARKKSGRVSRCRSCTRDFIRANPEKERAASRKWNQKNPDYYREWAKTPRGKEVAYQADVRRRKNHPEKVRARDLVRRALEKGHLTKLPCQYCGNPKTQAHHEDYGKPLEVIWVCQQCHIERFHSRRQEA